MEEIRAPVFISQEDVVATPKSNWYQYSLLCKHKVLSRVRLSFRRGSDEHYIRCPQCQLKGNKTLEWSPVESMEAVSDDFVRDVHDGSYFIVPRRILRTDRDRTPSGTPFPYITADSDI